MSGAIFPTLLGATFHQLPGALQDLHGGEHSSKWQGNASVRGTDYRVDRRLQRHFEKPSVPAGELLIVEALNVFVATFHRTRRPERGERFRVALQIGREEQ